MKPKIKNNNNINNIVYLCFSRVLKLVLEFRKKMHWTIVTKIPTLAPFNLQLFFIHGNLPEPILR